MNVASDNLAKQRNHPKIGLISFGLAIAIGFITLLILAISFILERGTYAEQRADKVLFVFALIAAPIFHLAGLVLGIIGAFKKDSKKLFPILGIIFNALPLVFAAVVWIFILLIALAVISSGGGWM